MTTSKVHQILRSRATSAMSENRSTVKLQPSQVLALLDIIEELEAEALRNKISPKES